MCIMRSYVVYGSEIKTKITVSTLMLGFIIEQLNYVELMFKSEIIATLCFSILLSDTRD